MVDGVVSLVERVLLARSEIWALRVLGVTSVTPLMRRVILAGSDLDRFATDDNLHVRLLLPPAGAPRQDWLDIAAPRASVRDHAPVYRKYTLRRVDPVRGEVAVDFVLHGDGPGAAWAAAAQPGDLVGMIGPGGRGVLPAEHYIVVGDETALPAIGRILEALPARARGDVLIEVGNAAEQQTLTLPPAMRLRWLHREAGGPGLAAALRELSWPALEAERVFVWVAAEFSVVADIRHDLDRVRRVPRSRYLAVSYWRAG